MGNGSDLPQELFEDILSRLPYKSLSRFRCVCKLWYSLLTGPRFVPPHLSTFIKHHSFPDTSLILRLSFLTTSYHDDALGLPNCKLFSLSANDSSAVDTLMPNFFAITSNSAAFRFEISGHCNGILCLSLLGQYKSPEVILYNPATREFNWLPDSIKQTDRSVSEGVGMGYDSPSDDYKVVRIRCLRSVCGAYITRSVDVYSLNNNSWTRHRNSNVNDFNFFRHPFALFYKGTYYWWGCSWREPSSMILGLDVGDEVFYQVPVPHDANIGKANTRRLLVWKESISLLCYGRRRTFDIWVMDGFGAQASWTKMHTITGLSLRKPLVFWKGNELLLQVTTGEIKSYNLDTQEETKNFKIEGIPIPPLAQAVNYVATLVSIKGIKRDRILI